MVCLSRPYQFEIFKGCLPQNSLGLFLNTLSQLESSTIRIPRVEDIHHFSQPIRMHCIKKGLVTFTEEILNEKLHFLCSDGGRKVTRKRFTTRRIKFDKLWGYGTKNGTKNALSSSLKIF